MSNWTQPVCRRCYEQVYPGREPVWVKDGKQEVCCKCGVVTAAGVYFRVDPTTVPYPMKDEDE